MLTSCHTPGCGGIGAPLGGASPGREPALGGTAGGGPADRAGGSDAPVPTGPGSGPDRAEARDALPDAFRSEEHTSELQSRENLVCRLLLEKKKKKSCEDRPENTNN